MLLGKTEDLNTAATMTQFSDKVVIKVGSNLHRVLRGPFLTRTMYWPTLIEEEGELRQKTRAVIVPKTGSALLKSLADAEKEFRRTLGEKEPRSQFTPTSAYLYLIFNKDNPEHIESPKVELASYKYTIHSRLEEIQSEPSTKDPTKLKNGLIIMYDVIIKKMVGDPNRPMHTTRYTVDVDTENNVAQGNIPIEVLKLSAAELDKTLRDNNIYDQIFTEAERKAIADYSTDIAAMHQPSEDEEIFTKLKEFPIFIHAKNFSTGNFLFPQMDKFMGFLEGKGLHLLKDGEVSAKVEVQQEAKVEVQQEAKVEVKVEQTEEVKTEQGSTLKNWNLKK